MNREANELMKIAQELSQSILNGKNRSSASRIVGNLLRKNTGGIFRDTGWIPIHKCFKELTNAGVEWELKTTAYRKNEDGNPSSKVWEIECPYINNNGRESIIYGHITASGAGTVRDPLEIYDVVTYAN